MANIDDKQIQEMTTKIQIVNRSIALIKEQGFSAVSVSEICKSLGITRGTFYYYFKTKDEIFDNYLLTPEQYIFENILPILEASNYRAQFFRIFELFSKRVMEVGPEIIRIVFKRNVDGKVHDRLPRKITMWHIYVELIKKGQQCGEIKNTADAETIVEAIIHMVNGLCVAWCNTNAGFDYDKECKRLINVIFA